MCQQHGADGPAEPLNSQPQVPGRPDMRPPASLRDVRPHAFLTPQPHTRPPRSQVSHAHGTSSERHVGDTANQSHGERHNQTRWLHTHARTHTCRRNACTATQGRGRQNNPQGVWDRHRAVSAGPWGGGGAWASAWDPRPTFLADSGSSRKGHPTHTPATPRPGRSGIGLGEEGAAEPGAASVGPGWGSPSLPQPTQR